MATVTATLTIAETVARVRALQAEVLSAAARHGQAPQGYWQQEHLEAIARRLQTLVDLYEEDAP